MSQTLLALVALMVAMQISMVQQRSVLNARLSMASSEMETVATGAGLDILDLIGSKPFDATTATQTITDPNDLTPLPFAEGGLFTDAQDIDDYNGIQPYVYATDINGIDFVVQVDVSYVDEDNLTEVSLTPTFSKSVTVTLSQTSMEQQVQLTRVFSYP